MPETHRRQDPEGEDRGGICEILGIFLDKNISPLSNE